MELFFRRGITKAWLVNTVTASAPTAVQILAGQNVSGRITDPLDIGLEDAPLGPLTEWGTSTVTYELGPETAKPIRLTIPEPWEVDALMTDLARGVQTNLVMFPLGLDDFLPTVGDLCEVWPVTSCGPRRTNWTSVAMWTVLLLPRATPVINVALV